MNPARGAYRYWRDGQPQNVREPWELERTRGSQRLQGSRIVDGRCVLEVKAEWRDGAWVSMDVRCQGATGERSAEYRVFGTELHWLTHGSSGVVQLPPGAHLFPLLRAAMGPLVAALARASAPVIVPDIRDLSAPSALEPSITARRAELLGVRDGERHLRCYGGEYGDEGADCWLDDADRLLRYRWASSAGVWEARLAEPDSLPDPQEKTGSPLSRG